jgi:hypothetical protein
MDPKKYKKFSELLLKLYRAMDHIAEHNALRFQDITFVL